MLALPPDVGARPVYWLASLRFRSARRRRLPLGKSSRPTASQLNASARDAERRGGCAGYFTIRNDGKTPEHLLGITADFATVVLHEMKSENGVMSMPGLKDGLNIPAHGTVRLAPGGYHAMFAHLGSEGPSA
jgi:hypothetical protein